MLKIGPKSDTYTFNQIKEIMDKNEETTRNWLVAFFNNTISRMETKLSDVIKENEQLKKEVNDVKETLNFQEEMFEKKLKELENGRKTDCLCEELKRKNLVLVNKLTELEDRSRRNNLRIDGIVEDDNETWDESETKVRQIIRNDLDIEDADNIQIERAHRSGKSNGRDGSRNIKRTIIVRFLNYKDKEVILSKYRSKQLWKKNIYFNEDFSERTLAVRKDLFRRAKDIRANGGYAKVVYNKLITRDPRDNIQVESGSEAY